MKYFILKKPSQFYLPLSHIFEKKYDKSIFYGKRPKTRAIADVCMKLLQKCIKNNK